MRRYQKEYILEKEEGSNKNPSKYGKGKMQITIESKVTDPEEKIDSWKKINLTEEGSSVNKDSDNPSTKDYNYFFDNEDDEDYLNDPLLRVHRISFKSKQLGKIRKKLGIGGDDKKKFNAPKIQIDLSKLEKNFGINNYSKKQKGETTEKNNKYFDKKNNSTISNYDKTNKNSLINQEKYHQNKEVNNNTIEYGKNKYTLSQVLNKEKEDKENMIKKEYPTIVNKVPQRRRIENLKKRIDEPKKEEIKETNKASRFRRSNTDSEGINKEDKKRSITRVTTVTVDLENDNPKREHKKFGSIRRKYIQNKDNEKSKQEMQSRTFRSNLIENPKKEENSQRIGGTKVNLLEKREITDKEPVKEYKRKGLNIKSYTEADIKNNEKNYRSLRRYKNEASKNVNDAPGTRIKTTEIKIVTEIPINRRKKY